MGEYRPKGHNSATTNVQTCLCTLCLTRKIDDLTFTKVQIQMSKYAKEEKKYMDNILRKKSGEKNESKTIANQSTSETNPSGGISTSQKDSTQHKPQNHSEDKDEKDNGKDMQDIQNLLGFATMPLTRSSATKYTTMLKHSHKFVTKEMNKNMKNLVEIHALINDTENEVLKAGFNPEALYTLRRIFGVQESFQMAHNIRQDMALQKTQKTPNSSSVKQPNENV